MSFAHPWWLLAGLIVVPLAAWLYDRVARSERTDALAYSDLTFFMQAAAPRRWIPAALRAAVLGGISVLLLAASAPRIWLPLPVHDGDVFICIDTSGSMQSTDVQPTRAEAAKAAARAFIDETPSGIKIGIVSFSSAAEIVQPLTANHEQAESSLADVPAPNGATAIGDALQLAAQSLPATGHRVVVLITDGVNNSGSDPQEVATWFGAHHIPIYTVGIGTPAGDVIPGTGEQATIDEDALRSYAQASGGAYARAENAGQLHDALARLGRITSIERRPVDASLGLAFAGSALLLITIFAGLGLGRFP